MKLIHNLLEGITESINCLCIKNTIIQILLLILVISPLFDTHIGNNAECWVGLYKPAKELFLCPAGESISRHLPCTAPQLLREN